MVRGKKSKPPELGKKLVLIIDDDVEITKVMSIYISRAGFEARTANSGYEAIKLLETFEPDAVILDIAMPDITGFDVCRWIRAHWGKSAVPVIAITGFHRDDTREKMLGVGANVYFTKPVDMAELLGELRELTRETPGG